MSVEVKDKEAVDRDDKEAEKEAEKEADADDADADADADFDETDEARGEDTGRAAGVTRAEACAMA